MPRPKLVYAGQVVFLTRRTRNRQYLLKPSAAFRNLMGYCLGMGLRSGRLAVLAMMCLCTHYHMTAVDLDGKRSDFMRVFHSLTARKRNLQIKRTDSLWEQARPGDAAILDPEMLEQKLLYTWLQPVAAKLCFTAREWPGLKFLPDDWGETFRYERPSYFGEGCPDYVEVTPQRPPGYEHLTLKGIKKLFNRKLRAAESEARRKWKTPHPRTDWQEASYYTVHPTDGQYGTMNPRYTTTCVEMKRTALQELKEFERQHQDARWRFYDGERDVEFPAGTYQMKERLNVEVAPVNQYSPFLAWRPRPPPPS